MQPSPGGIPGQRETITGVVDAQDNGCVTLHLGERGQRWIIWPDTTQTRAGADIVAGDHAIADGDSLAGTGALAGASVLPGWEDGNGSCFGAFGRFCSAGELAIVVFDEVAIAGE